MLKINAKNEEHEMILNEHIRRNTGEGTGDVVTEAALSVNNVDSDVSPAGKSLFARFPQSVD